MNGKDEKLNQSLKFCRYEEVSKACPLTCGQCCNDNHDYTFTKFSGNNASCRWLKARESRRQKYCSVTNKTFHGKTIREGCPSTCGFCTGKIEVKISDVSIRKSASLLLPPFRDLKRPVLPQHRCGYK